MKQIEIILRITENPEKVTERLLAKFEAEHLMQKLNEVLNYSGLCIDPVQHQISYQGRQFLLRKRMNFRRLFILPVSQGESSRKSRSTRRSGRRSRWM